MDSNMNSTLLKVFVAVANKRSISLGAQDLEFTQSNVTLRIKQLEKVLGYALFHRIPKGVLLTKEGKKLYPHAVEIVKKVKDTELYMRNISHQESLKIGTSQANASIRLLPFIEKIKKKFPQIKLELLANGTPQVIEALLEYQVDVAFVTGEPKHKDIFVLNKFDDNLYIVDCKTQKSDNCLIGYRTNSTHYQHLEDYYKSIGNFDYESIIIENYEVILGCVKAGMGKAFLSKTIIDKYSFNKDLHLSKMPNNNDLSTYLVCRKDYIPMIGNFLKRMVLK
jgi:DNA-binding transcriptional LysR family regulator